MYEKIRRIINVFIIVMFGFLFSNFIVYAIDNIPTEITIRTSNTRVGQIDYEDYTLSAYKIQAKEGYDVNKFTDGNPKVIKAIKNIYGNSKIATANEMIYEGKEYYFDKETQDVVMLFKMEYGGEKPTAPIEEPTPPIEKPIPPVVKLPQTGDESNLTLLAVIGATCMILGFYLRLNNPKA